MIDPDFSLTLTQDEAEMLTRILDTWTWSHTHHGKDWTPFLQDAKALSHKIAEAAFAAYPKGNF